MIPVSAVHQHLYHYTTAAGLQGIIESQQLFATSIRHLNDSQEQIGYFDHRLPALLEEIYFQQTEERFATSPVKMDAEHVRQEASEFGAWLSAECRRLAEKMDDAYVVSFSAPPRYPDDGLLSQWRGYGTDGGYALVFETKGLERLLTLEHAARQHQWLSFGDVEYEGGGKDASRRLPETNDDEAGVSEAIGRFLHDGGKHEALEGVYSPLVALSTRWKHRGFEEEREIRIVALRSIPEVRAMEVEEGELRPQREVFSRVRAGVLVPYLKLFGLDALGPDAWLPIKRVIVGPHPDKYLRCEAVRKMLQRRGIVADVIPSPIPYLPG